MDEKMFAVKDGAPEFFVAGSDDRPTDNRTVAVAIRVRCDVKVGDRDFSTGSFCLHEIAVMRRYYEGRGGGSIRPQPGWLPGLERGVRLTHDKLKIEVDRLRKSTIIPRVGQPPMIAFDDMFGSMPNEQLSRLHTVMKEQLEAWNKLMETCRKRVTKSSGRPAVDEALAAEMMTEREMDEIVNIANPAMRGLSELELPEIKVTADPAPLTLGEVSTEAKPEEGDDLDQTLDRLRACGIEDRKAMELASLLELVGDASKVADEDIAKIAGTKEKAVVAKLRKALAG